MSVCPDGTLACESLDLETSFCAGMQIRLQNIPVKFIYQGRQGQSQGHRSRKVIKKNTFAGSPHRLKGNLVVATTTTTTTTIIIVCCG